MKEYNIIAYGKTPERLEVERAESDLPMDALDLAEKMFDNPEVTKVIVVRPYSRTNDLIVTGTFFTKEDVEKERHITDDYILCFISEHLPLGAI